MKPEKIREIDEIGNKSARLVFEKETYEVIGAAMEVYYKLGTGFYESVYHEALTIEFSRRGIPYESEKSFNIIYKDVVLSKKFYADLICCDKVLVELKAVDALQPVHWAQVVNYLKAGGLRLGLLFNFGSPGRLEYKRVIV